jgi:hypothetical protein
LSSKTRKERTKKGLKVLMSRGSSFSRGSFLANTPPEEKFEVHDTQNDQDETIRKSSSSSSEEAENKDFVPVYVPPPEP